ncbi:MAG: bifunctional pyr operon transcriptional regulator/uracil phosphoribosyltransferase PyrR [Clostridia bacterium]|nr:bifunctional pyr operon transcriptional regulator/uracil phosphoribosyltransferase PyrR [Clostridia bacterium]
MTNEANIKAALMDEAGVRRALMRITHEIIEKNKGCENLCLVGIRRRGVPMAKILRDNLYAVEGAVVPMGELDITMFRDDLTEKEPASLAGTESLGIDIHGKHVVLVDDVLYTGRTIRAAIEALFAAGRPRSVQLAVLIDRGHRELPIRPDYVGKNVPTSHEEVIDVHFTDVDGDTGAYLCSKSDGMPDNQ